MSRRPRAPALNQRAPETTSSASVNAVVFLATAAPGRDISAHAKHDIIFAQGDDADSVFYIKKGRIKVAVVSKDEFCGEGCLIGQPKRLATASALTECETMRVSKAELQRVLLRRTCIFTDVHVPYPVAACPRRGGSGRSAI